MSWQVGSPCPGRRPQSQQDLHPGKLRQSWWGGRMLCSCFPVSRLPRCCFWPSGNHCWGVGAAMQVGMRLSCQRGPGTQGLSREEQMGVGWGAGAAQAELGQLTRGAAKGSSQVSSFISVPTPVLGMLELPYSAALVTGRGAEELLGPRGPQQMASSHTKFSACLGGYRRGQLSQRSRHQGQVQASGQPWPRCAEHMVMETLGLCWTSIGPFKTPSPPFLLCPVPAVLFTI